MAATQVSRQQHENGGTCRREYQGHSAWLARRPESASAAGGVCLQDLIQGTLMLMEEGRLILADPVSKFIPEFKNGTVVARHQPNDARGAGLRLTPVERETTLRTPGGINASSATGDLALTDHHAVVHKCPGYAGGFATWSSPLSACLRLCDGYVDGDRPHTRSPDPGG